MLKQLIFKIISVYKKMICWGHLRSLIHSFFRLGHPLRSLWLRHAGPAELESALYRIQITLPCRWSIAALVPSSRRLVIWVCNDSNWSKTAVSGLKAQSGEVAGANDLLRTSVEHENQHLRTRRWGNSLIVVVSSVSYMIWVLRGFSKSSQIRHFPNSRESV